MREIDGYGGVEFGPFSFHLKDGDPNDLPINDVREIIEQWTEDVQNSRSLDSICDMMIHGDNFHYVVAAPTLQDVRDRKIYIHVLKSRPQPQPMTFKFRYDFQTPSSRREGDTKKWWKRLLG